MSGRLLTRSATFLVGSLRPQLQQRARLARHLSSKATDQSQEQQSTQQRFFPRRCMMYIPGDDQKKLDKSLTIKPDTLVFDCEDGVAANRKVEARTMITEFIQKLERGKRQEYGVRINSVDSGLAEEDLQTVLAAEKIPHTIFLPKVESIDHIDWFAENLGKYMQRKDKDINLVIFAESAKSLMNLKDICLKAHELAEYHLFKLDGIVFGSDDFCASIGAERSKEANEVMVARQQIVIAAKAFDVQAIDVVYIDFKDKEGLKKQCEDGAKLGFTGKQCIHPDQIDIIHSAFTPSQEKITWATELIDLFNKHQAEGKGAFVFRGAMIDKPLLLQAQNIVNIANSLKMD